MNLKKKNYITAFHEAIGELLAISVVTPEYLQKIKLLPKINDDLGNKKKQFIDNNILYKFI